MTIISLELPEIGKPDKTQDPKINTAFSTIQNWANGFIDEENLSVALKEKLSLAPGKWSNLVLGPKMESAGSPQTPGARTELNAAVARLRGIVIVKFGEELKAGETLFTLPAGTRPPTQIRLGVVTQGEKSAYILIAAATGVATLGSASLGSEKTVFLDGQTFNLT